MPCRTLTLAGVLVLVLLLTGCARSPVAPSSSGASATTTAPAPAGPTATPQPPPPTITYTDVAFANANDGLVVGSRCLKTCTAGVWSTTDGGVSWREALLGSIRPDQTTFVDGDHGWLTATSPSNCFRSAGCSNQLLATADGGRTWRVVSASTTRQLSQVSFLDARTGFAVSRPDGDCGDVRGCGRLVVTHDGGATWRVVGPTSLGVKGFTFVDADHGWAVGSRCSAEAKSCPLTLMATTDGGSAWTAELDPGITSQEGGGSLSFINAQEGWAVLSNSAYCTMGGCWGPLYATSNGGQTWTRMQAQNHWAITRIDRPGFPGRLRFVTPHVGWLAVDGGAGGGAGGVARSTDGGQTWSRYLTTAPWIASVVSAPTADDAWAVGGVVSGSQGGFLLHTTDGGRSWVPVQPDRAGGR